MYRWHIRIQIMHMRWLRLRQGQIMRASHTMRCRRFRTVQPGVVGAVSDSEQVMAELICDGVHVDPAVVRADV